MRPRAVLLVMLLALARALPASDTAPSATMVTQPRAFGHFLGEVLTQRIALNGDPGNDPPHPPPPDRVDNWFERRTARVERSDDGSRWLVIEYQIVNVPPQLTDVPLPALTIALKDGRMLHTDAWQISLGPMTPSKAGAPNVSQGPRPDRTAARLDVSRLRWQLQAWAGIFGFTLAAWTAWIIWRNRRDAVIMPFARALRMLERSDGTDSVPSWIAMHRALDSTAGWVVHAGTLQKFLEERPALRPLGTELQEFYRQSSERFYARATFDPERSLSLLALCKRLRRVEKLGGLR